MACIREGCRRIEGLCDQSRWGWRCRRRARLHPDVQASLATQEVWVFDLVPTELTEGYKEKSCHLTVLLGIPLKQHYGGKQVARRRLGWGFKKSGANGVHAWVI